MTPLSNRLLAIDPGAHTGLALFEAGRLVRAALLSAEATPGPCAACPLCRHGDCVHLATGPAALLAELRGAVDLQQVVDLGVVEVPEFWSSVPNSSAILALRHRAAVLVGFLVAAEIPVLEVSPREWKGTTSKDLFQCEILAALDAAERDIIPRGPRSGHYQADVVDAVGLGCWALGRLGRWTVDPSSFAAQVEPAPARSRARKIGAGKRLRQLQCGLAFEGDR